MTGRRSGGRSPVCVKMILPSVSSVGFRNEGELLDVLFFLGKQN